MNDSIILWGGNGIADFSYAHAGMMVRVISVPARGSAFGGDIYYVTVAARTPVSTFLLVDVSGHGLETSPLFAQLRQPLEALIERRENMVLFRTLNRLVLDLGWHGNYATASAGTYDHEERVWRFAYAGHPNMLLNRDGLWRELPGHAGRSVPMGIVEDPEFEDASLTLRDEDTIVMYSDGFTDIRTAEGQRLGVSGVLEYLNSRHARPDDDLLTELMDELAEIVGGEGFEDDLTLIAVGLSADHGPPWTAGEG